MPEFYKSQATILGTTAATLIYPGTPGVTGTAIVNSIHISNKGSIQGSFGTTTATVQLNKAGITYSVITDTVVSTGTALQVLDAPMILENGNRLFATAGLTGSLDVIVSVMEIT